MQRLSMQAPLPHSGITVPVAVSEQMPACDTCRSSLRNACEQRPDSAEWFTEGPPPPSGVSEQGLALHHGSPVRCAGLTKKGENRLLGVTERRDGRLEYKRGSARGHTKVCKTSLPRVSQQVVHECPT